MSVSPTGGRPDVRPTDDLPKANELSVGEQDAARRAVLWRVDTGRLESSDAHRVLAALGLLPAQEGRR